MIQKNVRITAAIGLGVGGILGLAGTFAPTAGLRGLAWGVDGIALVMASALLAVAYLRLGEDVVAAGFLVFAIAESVVVSTSAMDLAASGPTFGAGVGLWAIGLVLISVPRVFPLPVRILGLAAAALFGVTALRIFSGAALGALSSPLPFYGYPVLVATMGGWIWTLLRGVQPPTR